MRYLLHLHLSYRAHFVLKLSRSFQLRRSEFSRRGRLHRVLVGRFELVTELRLVHLAATVPRAAKAVPALAPPEHADDSSATPLLVQDLLRSRLQAFGHTPSADLRLGHGEVDAVAPRGDLRLPPLFDRPLLGAASASVSVPLVDLLLDLAQLLLFHLQLPVQVRLRARLIAAPVHLGLPALVGLDAGRVHMLPLGSAWIVDLSEVVLARGDNGRVVALAVLDLREAEVPLMCHAPVPDDLLARGRVQHRGGPERLGRGVARDSAALARVVARRLVLKEALSLGRRSAEHGAQPVRGHLLHDVFGLQLDELGGAVSIGVARDLVDDCRLVD